MLLLIDAGNTRIKWATLERDRDIAQWSASGSVPHAGLASLAQQWQPFKVQDILISNVAGERIAAQLTELCAQLQTDSEAVRLQWFQSKAQCAGVHNGYRHPRQLGSDRFASLIGARHLFAQQSLLVVTCGTATTIDALDAAGNFAGGMILPGLATMAASLAVNTAQLPAVSDVQLTQLFADNTQDAIVSGCISAQVGAISRALAQCEGPTVRCILSGGAATFIAPHLPFSCTLLENLVLTGLAVSARTGDA